MNPSATKTSLGLIGTSLLLGFALALGGSIERAVVVAAVVAALIFVAYVFPAPTLGAYFAATLFVGAFSERMPQSFYDIRLPFGVTPAAALLASMLVAALLRALLDPRGTPRRRLSTILVGATILLSVWLVGEVARGIPVYGFSALAEFGQRYLVLAGALFVAANFGSETFRRQAVKILVATPGIVAFPAILISGTLTGWVFGGQHRFLHSSVTLALVLASTVVLIDMAYGIFGLPKIYRLVLIVAGFSFIVDAHRSVWLAGAAILALLVVAGWTSASRLAAPILGALPVLALLALAFPARALDVWSFFDERTTAFRSPLADQTAAWRAYVWLATLQQVALHPLTGTGFGGYWDALYIPELGRDSSIFPHSVYLMSLAKIGVVGLALYILFVGVLGIQFGRELVRIPPKTYESGIILLGLAGLLAAQVYGIAYGLEASAWLYVGLGVGGLIHWTDAGGAQGAEAHSPA